MTLIDFDHDVEKLFYGHDTDAKTLYESKLIILDFEKDKKKISTLKTFPVLGPDVINQYQWMLGGLEDIEHCKSAAVLPLIRSNQLIGTLLLLSRDKNRYEAGIATTFLQKLSAMTAVAIENCLNQQRIKEIGYQDPLTQAYNRRYFDLRFADEIERSLRQSDNLACMFLDVDFFKRVNDTYGHHVGDLVLTQLVKLIKEQVRACDIVARYGGEEFAVVLPGVTLEKATEIAERLRKAVETDSRLSCEQGGLSITVSIGMDVLSALTEENMSAQEIGSLLLLHADQALYTAKSSGRNQVVIHQNIPAA
ncbi:MAG: diguanylate cyclase, partial [Thiohalomonadales bacterium]